MAWPFAHVVAPNIDTGPGVAVPTSPAAAFANALWLLGAHFSNPGATQRVITVTDTAGDVLCVVTLPGGAEQPYEWAFRPTNGVTWSASGAGCVGHLWGYQ